MSMHRLLRDGARVLALLALCACGGTESPNTSTPVKIVAISGGGQTADLGQPLACSKITATLQPGAYTIAVGWSATPAPNPGGYRLQVRSGS